MKILFFGACVAQDRVDYLYINERLAVQHAAQKVSWLFIEGLDKVNGHDCDVICTMRVSPYPKFKKLIPFRLPKWRRRGNSVGLHIPYINLPGLCYLTMALNSSRHLLAWVWANRGEKKRVIVCYGMYTPCIFPAWLAARMSNSHCIMIVPDLPEYTGPVKNHLVATILRKINASIAHKISSWFDGLVVFSNWMVEKLDTRRLKWIQVEGCVDYREALPSPPLEPQGTRANCIMYSGSLNEGYGVLNLLQAFCGLKDPRIQLWICGDGDLKSEVLNFTASDARVSYFSHVSPEKLVAMQRSAKLLVNPRGNTQESTRYMFPSKNLEYMMSGRPVLLCRMDGIPEEYYENVYTFDGGDVPSLTKRMAEVLGRPKHELDAMGAKGKLFVSTQKTNILQCKKIMDLISDIQTKKWFFTVLSKESSGNRVGKS